jgi:hypothetical protein
MSVDDPQAAMNMAKGIADTGIRTEAQKKVVGIWQGDEMPLIFGPVLVI